MIMMYPISTFRALPQDCKPGDLSPQQLPIYQCMLSYRTVGNFEWVILFSWLLHEEKI